MTERSQATASDERFKNFIEERKLLLAGSQKTIEQYDKAVMTLAAGGLSISLLFIKEVAPHPEPSTFWLLHYGWGGFTVSLLLILCSFLIGYHSYRREVQVLEVLYRDPDLKITPPNRWVFPALVLNWLSAFALIFGATFIVYFAIMNPPNQGGIENMSKSQQPKSVPTLLINTAAPIASSQVIFGPATPLQAQRPAATNAPAVVPSAPSAQTPTSPPQTGKKQ
ncbi:MAG: hypothetical protein WCG79_03025 [Verrucomicrobiota bacterium]